MGKVELKLQIDADLLAKAQADGLDLAAALESVIRARLPNADDDDKARLWAEENAEAIVSYNRRIAARGLLGDDFRKW